MLFSGLEGTHFNQNNIVFVANYVLLFNFD